MEYEKIHRALKKSHDSEKRLMQKCRELNSEIVANSAKVATVLKLSQEDQATIASLKKVRVYTQSGEVQSVGAREQMISYTRGLGGIGVLCKSTPG